LPWPASIYQATNRGGPVFILNFDDDWLSLKDSRVTGAYLYWELVDGVPHFKFGEVPQGAEGAAEVRDELRALFLRIADRHGLELEETGRLGKYMSLARSTLDITSLLTDSRLDEKAAREHLHLCRSVHRAVYEEWIR
jgi:hypothetical protein